MNKFENFSWSVYDTIWLSTTAINIDKITNITITSLYPLIELSSLLIVNFIFNWRDDLTLLWFLHIFDGSNITTTWLDIIRDEWIRHQEISDHWDLDHSLKSFCIMKYSRNTKYDKKRQFMSYRRSISWNGHWQESRI